MYQTLLSSKTLLPFYGKETLRSFNLILAQVGNINKPVSELTRLNLIRLYLIKTFRGRGHSLGKPIRGQRT
jgi:ribosomal protein S13